MCANPHVAQGSTIKMHEKGTHSNCLSCIFLKQKDTKDMITTTAKRKTKFTDTKKGSHTILLTALYIYSG